MAQIDYLVNQAKGTTMTENNLEELGDERPLALLIQAKRQLHGVQPMTQRELAAHAGISVRQVKHYETCRALPRALDSVLRIAEALGLTVDELIPHWMKVPHDHGSRRDDV